MGSNGMKPRSLLAVLRGALDRRIKQRGRDTVINNAIDDPAKPLAQRVVESDACDHCKKLGNSLPVDPRKVAKEYHQYCKCYVALLFGKIRDAAVSMIRKRKAASLIKSITPVARKSGVSVNVIVIEEGVPGSPDYSLLSNKQKKHLTPEEKDAHIVLYRAGLDPSALPEDRGASANIDLLMSVANVRRYWELKNPTKGLGAQKSLTTEGVSKWRRIRNGKTPACVDEEILETPRLVIDNRGNIITDGEAAVQLISDMDYYEKEGFNEAILLAKDGFLVHFAK